MLRCFAILFCSCKKEATEAIYSETVVTNDDAAGLPSRKQAICRSPQISFSKRSKNGFERWARSIRNWREYESSLKNKGNLTLWLSPSAIKSWIPKSSGKPGRQQKYSDLAIETVLTLRLLFHLPLRQTEGFIESLFQLMKLRLPIPDHTTLFRRSKTLKLILRRHQSSKKSLYLIVDSTGLSIHGEGPWATGKKRRRGWRKQHIMVDREGFIAAVFRSGIPKMYDQSSIWWTGTPIGLWLRPCRCPCIETRRQRRGLRNTPPT